MAQVQKIRLLHIISSLDGGGVETMLKRFIKASADEFEHGIICINDKGRNWNELTKEDIWMRISNRKGRLDLSLAGKIRRLIREFAPHIIQGYAYTGNLWARLARPSGNIPIVTYERGTASVHGGVMNLVDRWLSSREALRLCNSRTSQLLTQKRLGIKNTRVIENFITVPVQIELEELTRPSFLWVGRLEWKRGAHLIPRFVEKMVHEMEEPIIYIAGEGSLRKRIEEEISVNGFSSNVVFLGMIESPYDYFSKVHCGIFLNLTESFGNSAAEMVSAGLPVAAPYCDNFPRLINDGKNGLLYAKGEKSEYRFFNVVGETVVKGSEPSIDSAISAVKTIYEKNREFKSRAKVLSKEYSDLTFARYLKEVKETYNSLLST